MPGSEGKGERSRRNGERHVPPLLFKAAVAV